MKQHYTPRQVAIGRVLQAMNGEDGFVMNPCYDGMLQSLAWRFRRPVTRRFIRDVQYAIRWYTHEAPVL